MWIATLSSMMTQLSSREFDLLKREMEGLAEAQARDRLESRAAIDRLKIELEAVRRAAQELSPDLSDRIQELRRELVQLFDPEAADTEVKGGDSLSVKDSETLKHSKELSPPPVLDHAMIRGLR